MHSCTPKKDVILDKESQKHLSNDDHKYGVIDQGKDRKRAIKRKWIYREYNVQDNADVAHKYVKMYWNTKKFPELPFCGPHSKPHGARGLSNNYHLSFDPKLRNVLC